MLRSNSLVALVVLALGSAAAHANMIGMNFTATRFGGGPYPILANETAGFVPQINWNNSNPVANGNTSSIASPLPGKLADNTGVDSAATITWFNANAEVNSSGGNLTPNERLYRGLIEGSFFTEPSPQLTISVTNIPYAKYDVIAYLAGFSFQAESSVRLGSQEFFYIQSSNFTTDGFIRATGTSYATRTLATYAVFEDLTASSFNLLSIKQTGNRPAIAGLQIVEVPEPENLRMMAIGAGALLLGIVWKSRRRRNPCG